MALVYTVAITSCSKQDNPVEINTETVARQTMKEGAPTTLGKKLENPYSVANMKRAAAQLTAARSVTGITPESIVATHRYVKFMPETWTQYDVLVKREDFSPYDYPLDYELEPGSLGYHDPSVPDSLPTPQYASVPVDIDLNKYGVPYTVLEDLFIPDGEAATASGTTPRSVVGDKAAIILLVNTSMKLTGNEKDTIQAGTMARSTYRPSGRIRVWDTRVNTYVPLRGVRVEARRWFTTHAGYTDANGNYSVDGTFKRDCNYKLIFECGDFDVRSGTFGQANVDGPKQDTPWNLDIWDGINRFYAHVFRGAQRYWRENIGGLKQPNRAWLTKMKYGAFDKNKEAWTMPLTPNPGLTPHVNIYRNRSTGGEWASDEIFSTTIHETAHWSHISNFGTPNFTSAGDFVRESWAVGVEWVVTQMEYREKGIANYGEFSYTTPVNYPAQFGHQNWRTGMGLNDYSCLFIDVVDNYNQLNQTFAGWTSTIDDQITGYTFAGIEDQILRHTQGKQDLFNRLKMYKPTGVTDAQIDVLTSSF